MPRTVVPTYTAPTRPHHSLLAWGLTACGVIAGPAVVGTAQMGPDLMLASTAIGLTAVLIGFVLWQRRRHAGVAAPARRRILTLGWSP